MIDKETYKKELTRMFASFRNDNARFEYCFCKCEQCDKCPLLDCCHKHGTVRPYDVFEVIEKVEKWSKEHQPKKLTRFEFEMLKWLDKAGYKFIIRSPNNNLIAHDSTPKKVLNGWVSGSRYKYLSPFDELLCFVKWEDEEPTSIQEVLKNCEVDE